MWPGALSQWLIKLQVELLPDSVLLPHGPVVINAACESNDFKDRQAKVRIDLYKEALKLKYM